MKKQPEFISGLQQRQRLTGRPASGPGSLDIKAAAHELLRKHERDSLFLPLCLSSYLPSASSPSSLSPVPQSQAQLPSWDRAPAISPADMRTDVFTARPSRSQSFRDPPLKGRRPISVGGVDIFGVDVIDPLTCLSFSVSSVSL